MFFYYCVFPHEVPRTHSYELSISSSSRIIFDDMPIHPNWTQGQRNMSFGAVRLQGQQKNRG
jgi:hypothetical protein